MSRSRAPFPVVGIGASAGGIEALDYFFRGMPTDIGMAFVIVTHLSPERESLLHEIVARYTGLVVEPARDGAELIPDHVFVLPENAIIGLQGGCITLRRPSPVQRERKPIDIFFSSLAHEQGEYAVRIILSGSDGDGTLGIKAIKERGGLTMAQVADGGGPRHPDMPDSAIASGMVDFAIPADKMAEKLVQFAQGLASVDAMLQAEPEEGSTNGSLAAVYTLLRNQVGHDFSGYKSKTFGRRVQRRMQVNQLDRIGDYVERLQQDSAEVAALFRDLLINVTNFFRDADAFDALKVLVIPRLFGRRGADDTIRVWIPGCSTGEEVYSIAILLREHLDGLPGVPRVQIFATDIDERALAAARAARYPEALLDGVSPERRQRFFSPDGGGFVVSKEVRDLCVFSPHSVIRDPPFSRIDLISCRNLLIYLGPMVQNEVIPTFHYALRPNGFLFLGQSENVSPFAQLFAPVDKKHRIFTAREDGHAGIRVPTVLHDQRSGSPAGPWRPRKAQSTPSLRQSVESHIMTRFAPPHVVVNAEGDIVFYSPRTGKYLEAAAGTPSRQLVGMARRGLSLKLRSALREAIDGHAETGRRNIAIEAEDDRFQMVDFTISPLTERDGEPLFLVLFVDNGPMLSRKDAAGRTPGERGDAVGDLEDELRETRERLQSLVEEYETALEELKSSNEELVSVNEELQSTNEELEASKEELQSLNEELQTVNLELSHKVDALDQSNADLRNLFENTPVATLFLDRDMAIRNFTPSAADLFDLVPSDRGRPLTSFSSKLDYPRLYDDIRATLETGQLVEQALASQDGQGHYLARFRPHAVQPGAARGIILTFVDITGITAAKARQSELIAELNDRVKTMLGIVVGMTRETAKTATSVHPFTEALVGRLQGLARSYERLSRDNWTAMPIEVLVRQELAAFPADRARVGGSPISLSPSRALSLGMILHELVSNSIRHGALSTPQGWLDVNWTLGSAQGATDRIHLVWREHEGPAVDADHRLGFGLKLLERETAYGLEGTASLAWSPDGLRIDIDIPAR